MSQRVRTDSAPAAGDSAGGTESSPSRRFVNSLAWALIVPVVIVLVALVTQFGTWGLVAGVILALVVLGGVAVIVGTRWNRAGAATTACVLGFGTMMFAGPTAYELYMGGFGEPTPALVRDFQKPDEHGGSDDSNRCVVAESPGGRTVVLDQRQNCFGRIRDGQRVTIFKDPLGALPPRLQDQPAGGAAETGSTAVSGAIALALLALTGGAVLYGGLRRRESVPLRPHEVGRLGAGHAPHNVADERPGVDSEKAKAMWIERRMVAVRKGSWQRREPSDSGVELQITGADAVQVSKARSRLTIAFPERQLAGEHSRNDHPAADRAGTRDFVLWADPQRHEVFARISTVSAGRGRLARYEVLDSAGRALATITRRPGRLLPPRRTRWTLQQDGHPPATGYKGRLHWWVLWYVTLPLQPVIFVLSLVSMDAFDLVRPPRRMKWRAGGEPVLDHVAFGDGRLLRILADRWDPRVTAALTTLLRSHEGRWRGR
jgi:hypothetical protein